MAFISLSAIVATSAPFNKHRGGETERRKTDGVREGRGESGGKRGKRRGRGAEKGDRKRKWLGGERGR